MNVYTFAMFCGLMNGTTARIINVKETTLALEPVPRKYLYFVLRFDGNVEVTLNNHPTIIAKLNTGEDVRTLLLEHFTEDIQKVLGRAFGVFADWLDDYNRETRNTFTNPTSFNIGVQSIYVPITTTNKTQNLGFYGKVFAMLVDNPDWKQVGDSLALEYIKEPDLELNIRPSQSVDKDIVIISCIPFTVPVSQDKVTNIIKRYIFADVPAIHSLLVDICASILTADDIAK